MMIAERVTSAIGFVDRQFRLVSSVLTPTLVGAQRRNEYRIFIAVVLAASLAAKLSVILSGQIMLTNTDGASRLFVAIDRFGDPDYFGSLSTWAALPMPIPQLYYSLLYALDLATSGAIPVTVSVLAANSVAFTAAMGCFSISVRQVSGPAAGAFYALLGVSAWTPNFVSVTAAVEPLGILFFSIGTLASIRALSKERPLRTALLGAAAFSLATAFRLEYFVLLPIFVALLYEKLGFARVTIFALGAFSYVAAYHLVQSLQESVVPYSEIRRFFSVIKVRSFDEFLTTSLFVSGMKLTWGAPILLAATAAAGVSLFPKRTRLFGLLAIASLAFVVFAVMSGRIFAGQPRYAMLAMCLLAMPASAAAAALFRRVVARLGLSDARPSKLAYVLIFGGAAALAAIQTNSILDRRIANPPAFARTTAEALLARIAPGESAFFDYGDSYDYPIAVHAMTKSRAPAYTYLSRCCVATEALRTLGPSEVRRLTSDKTVIMPGRSVEDKLLAMQIWAHGFIEAYRPRYFVIQRTKRVREDARRYGWPTTLSSTILPFASRSERTLNVNLRYANVRVNLEPVAQSPRFVLYEAHY